MLEEVRIEALGVIEDALLELSPNLTVVTGETGAGKTMVVSGLGLLLGGRADSALVRPGAPRAVVEGRLLVDPVGSVATRAEQAGAELDPAPAGPAGLAALLVSRSVGRDGRSRAYLGGRGVPIGLLAELAEDLVAVHGQSDQLGLLRPARQRAALDRYAGAPVTGPLRRYRAAYNRLRILDAELHHVTTRARERAQEADLLRLGLAEIAAADPQPEEDVRLAAELGRLSHADALRTAATTAHQALRGDPDVTSEDAVGLLDEARRVLDREREHDPAVAELADRLAEVGYLLADVAADLASYAAGIDADPGRLAEAQARTSTLSGLARKYGDTVADVLAWGRDAAARLAALDGDDERVEALRGERRELMGVLGTAAGELSAARSAAAKRLGRAVTLELRALAMAAAEVGVRVEQSGPARSPAYGPDGVDEVTVTLVPHRGAPARPIHKGASGGELSRVMLALEVVLAGADPVPTFVFDEVDAGVGGAAAIEVGRRLARLARSAQVVVVTHLPQVAAFADRHLVVLKADDGTVTRSGVRTLDGPGRVRELSRMLAGQADSATAAAHAGELLADAAAAKHA